MSTPDFHQKILSLRENLYSLAGTLTTNVEDIRDLVQDTILKALSSENSYIDGNNFKDWMYSLMHHLYNVEYRRNARLGIIHEYDVDPYHITSVYNHGLDTPQGTSTGHDIEKALETFSPDYREPFALYLSGYKYVEIARRLGLPLGTVKSRIYMARTRMQTLLSDYSAEV